MTQLKTRWTRTQSLGDYAVLGVVRGRLAERGFIASWDVGLSDPSVKFPLLTGKQMEAQGDDFSNRNRRAELQFYNLGLSSNKCSFISLWSLNFLQASRYLWSMWFCLQFLVPSNLIPLPFYLSAPRLCAKNSPSHFFLFNLEFFYIKKESSKLA